MEMPGVFMKVYPLLSTELDDTSFLHSIKSNCI